MILQSRVVITAASAHTQVLAQLLITQPHSPSGPQLRLPTRFLISEHSCPPTLHTSFQQSALLHPHSNFQGSLFCIPRTTSCSLRYSRGQLPFRPSDKPTLLFSRDRPGGGAWGGDWSQEGLNLPLPLPVLLSTPCAGDQLSTLGAPPREASYINNDENPFFPHLSGYYSGRL